jgi:hypothetical protein
MTQIIKPENTFGKKCKVQEMEGTFWLVRKGRVNSRVVSTTITEPTEGVVVETSKIFDVEEFTPPVSE